MEFKVNYNQREQATEVSGYITDSELHGEKEYIKRTVLNNLLAKIADHLFKRVEPTLNDLFKSENVYPEITECILEKCKEFKEEFKYDYNKAFNLAYIIAEDVLAVYPNASPNSVTFLIQESLKKVYEIGKLLDKDANEYVYEKCRQLIREYKTYEEAESFIETITKEVMNIYNYNGQDYVRFLVKDTLKKVYSQ